MAYKKLATLAKRLHKRTLDGKISWEETAEKGVYQASFVSYSVRISVVPSPDEPNTNDMLIRIFDEEGSQIEAFLDTDIFDFGIQDVPPINFFNIMKETYDIARRFALGSEQAVDEILSHLDDDSPF